MRHSYLSVLGKPFFSIGGQVHNSSAYPIGRKGNPQYEEDSERSFESIKAIGGNTIAVPICWDAFEPEEGAYNAGYVHTVIDNIRRHGLHGTLLWFGTWKNGQMEYTPSWVKKDRERFPRVLCKDGTQTTVLSPHSRRNLEQDAKAFRAFMEILREYDGKQGTILAVQVEGISAELYYRAEDHPLLETVLENRDYKPRCEFLAPLDCFLWDRKLIKALFGFEYSWEIYTPAPKRKYGFYVLPILYGDRFAGRIEAVCQSKTNVLLVKNIWYEDGVRQTKKLLSEIDKTLKRFARFNQCGSIQFETPELRELS